MYRKERPDIFWDNNLRTYMYGSEVRFDPAGSVHFYNPLIPSGTEIIVWEAIQNYQGSRTQPALPLLKKGHHYRLSADLEADPAQSVFLKIVFLNRYNEELSQVIEKERQVVFTYPEEAYSYRVSLLSAGVTSLEFQSLKIEEVGDQYV